jgi:hypothetical protein
MQYAHGFTIGARPPLHNAVIANGLTLPSDALPNFFERTVPSADERLLVRMRGLVQRSQPLVLSLDFTALLTDQDLIVRFRKPGPPLLLPTPLAAEWNTILRDLTGRKDMYLADFCREQEGGGVEVGVEQPLGNVEVEEIDLVDTSKSQVSFLFHVN